MLRTTKNMKDKYEKIQTYLFVLIPEKWEAIYLYASVISGAGNAPNGELYFYYLPKGILKKKPINVYEIPHRFNINEEQYLSAVEKLYSCIKELKQDFVDTDQDLWTSITISIANSRFRIEFCYDKLPRSEKESEANRVIWRYKYLKIGGEKKEERKILEEFYNNREFRKKEIYETGLYMKLENNSVDFDKENIHLSKEITVYEKESQNEHINKKNTHEKENKEIKPKKKNQILNM